MIDLSQILRQSLQKEPYSWGAIGNIFSPKDAAALAATFPRDHFKTVLYYGERDYEYDARSLIGMGADTISFPQELSEAWLELGRDLLSPSYRVAMSLLTGRDLTTAPVEVNVFHYGAGANLGPHPDLDDKIVTHILYFNSDWNRQNGGCLTILRSADPGDVAAEVEPVVGNSAVVVRSEKSWHAVSRVVKGCTVSRRSLTATFYREGSVSTMWPPGDTTQLHRYEAADLELRPAGFVRSWRNWRRKIGLQTR